MKKKEAGFTLVELLIVVSIIAILTSVVTQSTTSARAKARDAKAKRSMSEFVTFAARYATENGSSYVGLCASGEANTIIDNAFKSVAITRGASDCISDYDEYIVAVPMIYKSGYLFCTDHTGGKYEIESSLPVSFTDGSVSCNNQ